MIEVAKRNRSGNPDQVYKAVGTHLIAYACKISFENWLNGYVVLKTKTLKEGYYEKLGVISIGGRRMVFETKEARDLLFLCKI